MNEGFKHGERILGIVNRARAAGSSAKRICATLGGEPVKFPSLVLGRDEIAAATGEERYDLMDAIEAAMCPNPSSCSGYIVQ